nr:MAG TPA: hypothetical protein [Caudoviricetes sp.]
MPLSKNENKRQKQLANLEKGKFKKGKITNPKGRPPKPRTMTTFIAEMKEKGYEVPTAQTIAESFLYIATLPEDELKAVLADKTRPMMQRIVAKGILDKKGMDILERVVDRAYGKIQHIDLTSKGEQIKQDPLQVHVVTNNEEYQKILAEIQKEKEKKDAEPDRTVEY